MSASIRGAADGDSVFYLLRVVRDRRWLILGTTVGMAFLALLFSSSRPKEYTSEAQVVFGQSLLQDSVLQQSTSSGAPERDAATRVLVATSTGVAARVQRQLRVSNTSDELLAQVIVEAEPNANVLNFTAVERDPAFAARLANAFATEYIAFERESLRRDIERARGQYEQRLARLQVGTPQYETQRSQLDRLIALQDLGASDTQLIGRAVASSTPSSPQPKRDALLGLILGAIFGLSLALLLDLLDRRVKEPEDFERQYGQPVLATVAPDAFVVSASQLALPEFEPYRILRTAVNLAAARQNTRVVLVTSAVAGEGKTSVALNLVRAFAQSGQPAILVEADLRKPSVGRRLGLDDRDGGVTTVLAGRHRPRDLLHEIPGELSSGAYILPAGPLAPNAPQLLTGPRMGALVAELAAGPEVIVIDAAPLLPVADTQALLNNANVQETILVGRAYETKREDIRRCRAILRQLGCDPLGLVVTGVATDSRYDYYGRGRDNAPLAVGGPPPGVR